MPINVRIRRFSRCVILFCLCSLARVVDHTITLFEIMFTRHKHLAIVIILFHPWYLFILCVFFLVFCLFLVTLPFACVCVCVLFFRVVLSFCLCSVWFLFCFVLYHFTLVCTVHFVAHFFFSSIKRT